MLQPSHSNRWHCQPAGLITLLALLALQSWCAAASGTVTNCTEAGLNNALAGGGLVTLTCAGPITFTSTKVIATNTTIEAAGAGATISGGNALRLFTVNPGVTLTLKNLTLANGGLVGASRTNGASGNSLLGGAIYNNGGTVIALNCPFTSNAVSGGNAGNGVVQLNGRGGNGGQGGNATGGAIYNNGGSVFLTNCAFTANSATGGAGGHGADALAGSSGNGGDGGNGGTAGGGAIYNSASGSVVVYDCTFTSNRVAGATAGLSGFGGGGLGFDGANGAPGAGNSGAIYNDGGSLTVAFSTFNLNRAVGAEGGDGTTGPFDADGIGGTSGSSANGGGIFNNAGTVALTNCTFAANSVTGGNGGNGGNGGSAGFGGDGGDGGAGGPGNGGGLYNAANGSVLAVNCTFSLNQFTGGIGGTGGGAGSTVTRPGQTGGLGANKGGAIGNGGGSVTLKNTILAYGSPGINAAGTILDGGNNLSSDATPFFTSPASRINIDPLLLSLANNGGFTLTAALAASSPAINQGNNAASPPTDQRHLARTGHSDIGAYEFDGRSATATLHARKQNNELIITWPELASGYTLEYTPDLSPLNWTNVTDTPAVVNFEYVVTNTLDGFSRFYRLRQ